jgi:beta-carotene ketolase (CrtO type)
LSTVHDVIVVGAGHNGLTAAAYLARHGRDVEVLEARSQVGGFCTTAETIAEAPGYRINPCALDCVLMNVPRRVTDELQLDRHGLRFVAPDPWGSFVGPDGASIALWRDRARTIAEIARFSRRDATAFDRFCTIMRGFWWAAIPYLQDHPTRPRARTVGEIAWRVARNHRSVRRALKTLLASPEQVLEEWFERDEVKSFMANFAAISFLPLQESGAGAMLGAIVICFEWGVTRPIGGSGALTGALKRCIVAHGGSVRTDAAVEQIMVSADGVATGVRLASGEEHHARQVIGAIDPTTLVGELIDPQFVPEQTASELRALNVLKWNISHFKADAVLSSRPRLACGRDELLQGYLLLAPTLDHIRRAQAGATAGVLTPEPPQWMAMPSVPDRTQVPDGAAGETFLCYAPIVPLRLRDGKGWDAIERDYFGDMVKDLELYVPGLERSIIGSTLQNPDSFRDRSFAGHVMHADVSISQMGPRRPTPSLSGYRTPIKRLWHSASGAHPIGLLSGWPGRTTARLVDRDLTRVYDSLTHTSRNGRVASGVAADRSPVPSRR